ncbi:MAG: tRNA (adenosine(37)-N6)-dimethylallyltransferase MiaA [Mycoplasma sp.]|nr:tRNA (adenosine(37)-N6)-dimethylallyltransferase MiaA [Mycoplasma sp.]
MQSKLSKIIVIVGPTTSHKTKLAILIANKFNGEIINADAYQVYRDMSIGTNAPTTEELSSAKFHLNQTISLKDEWDIKKFQTLCFKTIDQLLNKNKLPIIVGGSNLYVESVIKNYDLSANKRSCEYDQYDNQKLYDLLSKLNHKLADKICINNRRRLTRALEVINQKNDKKALEKTNKPIYDYLMIECNYPTRQELYDSINHKVDEMVKSGWEDEVKTIIDKYPGTDLSKFIGFKAIGYGDIYYAINNNIKVDYEKIKQKIRHYAKRQITWINNKYPQHLLFNQTNQEQIFNEIKKWITK